MIRRAARRHLGPQPDPLWPVQGPERNGPVSALACRDIDPDGPVGGGVVERKLEGHAMAQRVFDHDLAGEHALPGKADAGRELGRRTGYRRVVFWTHYACQAPETGDA